MERLSHAVVGDLTKIGEGRLGDYGAEVWMGVERLEELRGAHGFAEGEDAVRVILRVEKIEPLVDIVTLEQAEGSQRASADAVGSGVGQKDGESVGDEQLRVSGHADAVVAEAMEEKDGIAVGVMRADAPGAEGNVVGRGDGL